MTNFGYVKRQKVDTYRTKRRGGRGISGMNRRAEDVVSDMFVAGTHDYVLFFTNLGKVYRMKCYMIPEGSRTAKGMNINNLLTLAPDEKVTSMIRIPEEGDEGMYLVMITKKGLIKRTATQSFHSLRNKGGLIALGLEDDDELVWVRLTDGHSQLLIATRNGMAIRIDENEVRNMSRVAKGVKAIRLRGDDQVIGMSILREDAYILTVSEKGYGRLSPQSDYRIQSRGGHGLINYHTNKFGKVAAIKAVDLEDDIILISDNGIILRISASSIRICARPSKGVILMKMNDESKIVTLSRAPHEEEIPDAMNDADDDDDDDDESL